MVSRGHIFQRVRKFRGAKQRENETDDTSGGTPSLINIRAIADPKSSQSEMRAAGRESAEEGEERVGQSKKSTEAFARFLSRCRRRVSSAPGPHIAYRHHRRPLCRYP